HTHLVVHVRPVIKLAAIPHRDLIYMLLAAFFGGIDQLAAHLGEAVHIAGVHQRQRNLPLSLYVLQPLRAAYGVQPEIAVLVLETYRIGVYLPVGPPGRYDS